MTLHVTVQRSRVLDKDQRLTTKIRQEVEQYAQASSFPYQVVAVGLLAGLPPEVAAHRTFVTEDETEIAFWYFKDKSGAGARYARAMENSGRSVWLLSVTES